VFVLDALIYASDWLDGSLAFRWSCRMGVCGSCGALVDGTPRLTCAAPIPETGEKVVIEPLHNFPVQKDLGVDIGDFMEKLGRVEPWIIRERERESEEGEDPQKTEEVDKSDQVSDYSNCILDYAACPVLAV